MMDRREALKKLAAGGATAAGAAVLVSRPAFADGGSVTSRSTPIQPVPTYGGSGGTVTVTVPIVAPACTYSDPGPSSARLDYSAQAVGATEVTGFTAPGVFNAAGASGNRTVTLTATGATLGGTRLFFYVRTVCREPGGSAPGTPAWACLGWEFVPQPGGVFSVGSTITSVPGCDTPPPT